MIKKWETVEIVKNLDYFEIKPIIEWDEASEDQHGGLSRDEHWKLDLWGFCDKNGLIEMKIMAIRQIDMLEHDFPQVDVSELRKMAKEMNLQW